MPNQAVYTCRQYRLLIAGSRYANSEMLETAYQAVLRAKANGWLVLVGDNPKGIDAAVIAACDQLGVKVIVFGITARPRKGSQQADSYWRVDTKVRENDEYTSGAAYKARDRYMIDFADRAFFIHDGKSAGTKAGYEYACKIGKPTDIRTFSVQSSKPAQSSPKPASKPSVRQLHTVELIVEISECAEKYAFEGHFGLRALDDTGSLLYDAHQVISLQANTSDGARMQTIIAALERLTTRLKSQPAAYRLRIYQNSKNVDGWLAQGWKRNVPEVRRLAGRIDALMKVFPNVQWIKESRPQLQNRLSKIRVKSQTSQ